MLKVNGYLYQAGPLCMPNHGFYGYNPCLFYDFYEDNGFVVQECFMDNYVLRHKLSTDPTVPAYERERTVVTDLPQMNRFALSSIFKNNPSLALKEYSIHSLMLKINQVSSISFPIQGKYRTKEKWM